MSDTTMTVAGSGTLQPFGVNLFPDNVGIPVFVHSRGLPFHLRRTDRSWRPLAVEHDRETIVPCGWTGQYLSLLGHISSEDSGTGSWYSKRGDMSQEQFIGDRLGEIEIVYADATSHLIPLVFGFTLWWDQATRPSCGHGGYLEPFASDAQSRQLLDDALMIRRFVPPHEQSDGASVGFVSLIELRPLAVSCLKVRRTNSFAGHPVFVGVTGRLPWMRPSG